MKAEKNNGCCTSFALALGRGIFALALVAFWQVGHAAKSADFGKNAISQNGKTTTIHPMGSINSGGSTIPVTPTVGGWTGAGNYGFPPTASGPTAGVNYKGQFADGGSPTGQAMKYPYTGNSTVPWADVAKGIGTMGCSLISGGVAALACAVAVPLTIDWISKGKGRLNPQTGALERADPNYSQSDGFSYRVSDHVNSGAWPFMPTPSAACVDAAARMTAVDTMSWTFKSLGAPYGGAPTCVMGRVLKSTGVAQSDFPRVMQKGAATPNCPAGSWVPNSGGTCSSTLGGWIPATMDDIAPYMGTPADGRVIGELLDKGAEIPLSVPTITGPSAIPGPVTTTINNDGSRTVTTTTNNYTTSGNTVTNNSTVTTTTTYNTDNSVRNSSTTTTVPTEEAEKEDACKARPDSLGCAELDTPEGTIPKDRKEVSYTAESVWGGGSCPADKTWSSRTTGQSYTLIPWSKVCDWATLMRAVVLIMATWAAFWIVMPGNSQVKPQ